MSVWSGVGSSHGAEANAERRRVGVIGAGFGGLACAFELSEAGFLVDVYEARNRLGGRVHSVDSFAPGRMAERGAELIGSNHPQWLAYAQKFNIELEDLEDDDEPAEVVIDGHRYAGEEAKQLAVEVDIGHEELAKDSEAVNLDSPWETPDAERLDRLSLADRIRQMKTTDRAKRFIFIEFLHDMACSPERMGYLPLLCVIKGHGVRRYWPDTEKYRAKHGNQILASHLAAGVSGHLHLDCPVTRIERKPDGCELKLRDGRTESYPDVVLSVPPSVWDRIEFVPPLPSGFALQMGSATKFLMLTNNKLSDGSLDLVTDTLIGMTWEGAEGPPGSERLIASFTGGTIADDLHQMPLAERDKLLTNEFDQLLPGIGSQVLRTEFVDWIGDEWTKGGYSFPRPGEFLKQIRILKDGLDPLHFAGEHASIRFFGFMEGGLHSGVQAARKLQSR
jgi:monoamine oxidase